MNDLAIENKKRFLVLSECRSIGQLEDTIEEIQKGRIGKKVNQIDSRKIRFNRRTDWYSNITHRPRNYYIYERGAPDLNKETQSR